MVLWTSWAVGPLNYFPSRINGVTNAPAYVYSHSLLSLYLYLSFASSPSLPLLSSLSLSLTSPQLPHRHRSHRWPTDTRNYPENERLRTTRNAVPFFRRCATKPVHCAIDWHITRSAVAYSGKKYRHWVLGQRGQQDAGCCVTPRVSLKGNL